MPDGGLAVENERKSRLAESRAQTRRQSSSPKISVQQTPVSGFGVPLPYPTGNETERQSALTQSHNAARRTATSGPSPSGDRFKKIESQDPEVKYQTSLLKQQELNDELAENRRLLAENRARFGGPEAGGSSSSSSPTQGGNQFKKIESQDPEVKLQASRLKMQEIDDELAEHRRFNAENRARFGGPSSSPAFSRDPSAFARLAATAGKEGQPSGEQTIPPEQQPAAAQQLQRGQQQGRLAQMKQQLLEEGGPLAEQKKKAQKEVRKQMNVAVRRGIEEAAQGIGNAIDIGGVGTPIIITIFVYAFTLVDLNLQMASYYIKNQTFDFFFPSLTWSPIPMPAIVSVKFLHIALVVVDLLLVFILVIGLSVIIITTLLPYMIAVGGVTIAWSVVNDAALRAEVWNMISSVTF